MIKNQALRKILDMIDSGMPWEAVQTNPLSKEIHNFLIWQSGKIGLLLLITAAMLGGIGYVIKTTWPQTARTTGDLFLWLASLSLMLTTWLALATWNIYIDPIYYVQEYCYRVLTYGYYSIYW